MCFRFLGTQIVSSLLLYTIGSILHDCYWHQQTEYGTVLIYPKDKKTNETLAKVGKSITIISQKSDEFNKIKESVEQMINGGNSGSTDIG